MRMSLLKLSHTLETDDQLIPIESSTRRLASLNKLVFVIANIQSGPKVRVQTDFKVFSL